jgi:hypothetical protein
MSCVQTGKTALSLRPVEKIMYISSWNFDDTP